MESEFIPYNLALRLKALGYDETCFGFYYRKEINLFQSCEIQKRKNSSYVKEFMDNEDCVAPTWQSSFKWFRDNYGFHVTYSEPYPVLKGMDNKWRCSIKNMNRLFHNYTNHRYIVGETYEEAQQKCLFKLIEIVESINEKNEKNNK